MTIVRVAQLAAVSSGLLFASVASAQSHRPASAESPQNFAFELRFGAYYPQVDSESFAVPAEEGPFERSFGKSRRFLIGGEFDWQVVRIPYIGTLGPGLGVHYTKFGAKALMLNGQRSAEDTSLMLMPMHLVAVLRVDVLAREVGIPLVPYVKAGLGYALWRMTDGSGTSRIREPRESTNDQGQTTTELETVAVGKGYSLGPQFALGISLLLDSFDEYTARQADVTLGINNTYLYAELFSSHLNWALDGPGLRVGSTSFVGGIAFEF